MRGYVGQTTTGYGYILHTYDASTSGSLTVSLKQCELKECGYNAYSDTIGAGGLSGYCNTCQSCAQGFSSVAGFRGPNSCHVPNWPTLEITTKVRPYDGDDASFDNTANYTATGQLFRGSPVYTTNDIKPHANVGRILRKSGVGGTWKFSRITNTGTDGYEGGYQRDIVTPTGCYNYGVNAVYPQTLAGIANTTDSGNLKVCSNDGLSVPWHAKIGSEGGANRIIDVTIRELGAPGNSPTANWAMNVDQHCGCSGS